MHNSRWKVINVLFQLRVRESRLAFGKKERKKDRKKESKKERKKEGQKERKKVRRDNIQASLILVNTSLPHI